MAEGIGRTTQEYGQRLLGECALFRGLSPVERKVLVAKARVRTFSSGDTVFLMGSQGDSMMAVLDGNVRISVSSPAGKEIVLAIMHAGDVFGEIALLDGKGRTADAKAVSACSLAILERRDVLAFFAQHPGRATGWQRPARRSCGPYLFRLPSRSVSGSQRRYAQARPRRCSPGGGSTCVRHRARSGWSS
jgi:Cyclic nucleotide-binding domain